MMFNTKETHKITFASNTGMYLTLKIIALFNYKIKSFEDQCYFQITNHMFINKAAKYIMRHY